MFSKMKNLIINRFLIKLLTTLFPISVKKYKLINTQRLFAS